MKPKRIGIDARLYFQTGVGTYLRNLLHFLPETAHESSEFYVYVLPQDRASISLSDRRFVLREADARWHSLSEQTTFYRVIMQDNIDLMHFTYFSYPIFYKRPFIATVHDLTPLLFKTGRASTLNPLWYEMKFWIFKKVLSTQVQYAQKIITPSESVKKQLLGVYGSDYASKTQAIPEGVNFELQEAEESLRLKSEVGEDYFLYVGNFYPHKNVESLIQAYKLSGIKTPLVMTGPDNTFSKRFKYIIEKEGIETVRFIHDTDNGDLVYLYKHAKALINPSLSEGFGLPLVEAAYFGCPVIASDIPVFKELLGEDYTAFNPYDAHDIASALKLTTYKSAKLQQDFSFKQMAKRTMEAYSELTK